MSYGASIHSHTYNLQITVEGFGGLSRGQRRMPGMNGADLQDRLIADGHRTPIIFVTAFPDEDVRARVLKAGACGFLTKPFSDESLIECLDKALVGGRTDPASSS